MSAFAREHLRPLVGSAALHLLLLATLVTAAFHWRSEPPPVRLAIEGSVVQYKDLPRSLRGNASARIPAPMPALPVPSPKPEQAPEPKPEPKAEPTPPKPAANTHAEEAERAKAAAALEKRQADAAKRKAAEADARKQAAADAESKRKAAEDARQREEAKARSARDAKLRADRQAELNRALAAEEEGAAIAQSGVVDEYRALLVQTIERNWIRPPSARAGLECTLNVTQATGGTVVDVKLGECNGDQAVRESIANAVYRSSPLPAPRDPRAFERRLVIVFKPTE
jgi:colicin import membrane protein